MLAVEYDDCDHGVHDRAAAVTIRDLGTGLLFVGMNEVCTMRPRTGNSVSAQTCRLRHHEPAFNSGRKGLVEGRRRVRLRQCTSTAGRDHERQDSALSLRQAIGRAGQYNSECIVDLLRDGPWS